jgi:glycosyltransferase involved in cell wall biosynthesis
MKFGILPLNLINLNLKYFTIIIVVKNNLEGLKKTIASIESNLDEYTKTTFNIMFVDGDSTDGTWEYINDLKSNFNIEIFQEKPTGIYPAMNFAIKNVKTEWIWFMNSSDIITTPLKFITETIINMRNDEKISVIAGQCGLFFTKNERFVNNKVYYKSLAHQATIYKTDLHIRLGNYDEKFKTISDRLFLEKIPTKEIIYMNNYFAATLVSPYNTSRNYSLYYFDYMRFYRININYKVFIKIIFKTSILFFEKKIKFSLTTWFLHKLKNLNYINNDTA